jgi:hypothetical protein
MITPQLNINGSSAADLIDPRLKAMANLDLAIEALSQAVPNGRDYPGNAALSAIREEIYAEAIAIKQQQKEY